MFKALRGIPIEDDVILEQRCKAVRPDLQFSTARCRALKNVLTGIGSSSGPNQCVLDKDAYLGARDRLVCKIIDDRTGQSLPMQGHGEQTKKACGKEKIKKRIPR